MTKTNMTQLMLDVINRKNTTYLPSQIAFSTADTKAKVQKDLGFSSDDELDAFLQNHVYFTATLDDIVSYYYGDVEKMEFAEKMGYAKIYWDRQRVRDRWGLEMDVHAPDGFFNWRNPLKDMDEEMLDAYHTPSIDNPDELFSMAVTELEKYSSDYLVLCNGYAGIFERSYNLTSFEDFMYYLAAEPELACKLMDKVLDYKMEIAKETVKRGFKSAHYGDDLGTQTATMMSKEMFRSMLLPRMKKLFRIYKDGGMTIQMHSCGWITDFIPDLVDIGLDVLEPVQPIMDISYLKREFGKDITFYGGIDTQDLMTFQKPEKVREEVLRTIDILGNNGGYICAPSQEIMPNVPLDNILAFVNTVKEVRGSR